MNATPETSYIKTKLSIVMFLQFFIWGSWYTTVSLFMLENGMGDHRFYAYTAGPLGAIFAPFFVGLIADRFFNTEKVLSVLFLLCGASMLYLPNIAGEGKGADFNNIILLHMLFYMPTLGLTASYSFKLLKNSAKEFPLIRLWGTVGWIAVAFIISFLDAEKTSVQFYLGGTAGILLGLFCLVLPKTPAPLKGQPIDVKSLIFWDAWKQLKSTSFLVFILGSFAVCLSLAAYYASVQQQLDGMKIDNISMVKSFGQIVEIGCFFIMPFFFVRFGVKKMLLIGIAAWALRYALFAFGASQGSVLLVIIGILLHGICYDFFFVTGQVYVDRETPKEIRNQAQGMLIFFTQGLGLYCGALLTQELATRAFGDKSSTAAENIPLWADFWYPLSILTFIVLVAFAILFRPQNDKISNEEAQALH